MKKIIFIALLLFTFFSLRAQNIDDKITGNWSGKGKIIVTWCKQDSLSFDIKIESDGKVFGKIGDAEITDGKIEKRSAIMKALGNGDYIITGKLNGKLAAKENIERDSFILMFSKEGNFLRGGFHTSGSKFGGKDEMVLTVSPLELKKIIK